MYTMYTGKIGISDVEASINVGRCLELKLPHNLLSLWYKVPQLSTHDVQGNGYSMRKLCPTEGPSCFCLPECQIKIDNQCQSTSLVLQGLCFSVSDDKDGWRCEVFEDYNWSTIPHITNTSVVNKTDLHSTETCSTSDYHLVESGLERISNGEDTLKHGLKQKRWRPCKKKRKGKSKYNDESSQCLEQSSAVLQDNSTQVVKTENTVSGVYHNVECYYTRQNAGENEDEVDTERMETEDAYIAPMNMMKNEVINNESSVEDTHGVSDITPQLFSVPPSTNSESYMCIICGKRYPQCYGSLKRHIVDKHGMSWKEYLKLYSLDFNLAQAKLIEFRDNYTRLDEHRFAEPPQKRSCEICRKRFDSITQTILHMQRKHKGSVQAVTIINKMVEERRASYLRTPSCTRSVVSQFPVSLDSNESGVSTQEFICLICSKHFLFHQSLVVHHRQHTLGWRQFQDQAKHLQGEALEKFILEVKQMDRENLKGEFTLKKNTKSHAFHRRCPICNENYQCGRNLLNHLVQLHTGHPELQKHLYDVDNEYHATRTRKPNFVRCRYSLNCHYCSRSREGRRHILGHLQFCHSDEEDIQAVLASVTKQVKELHRIEERQLSQTRYQKEVEVNQSLGYKYRCPHCDKPYEWRGSMHRHARYFCTANPQREVVIRCERCSYSCRDPIRMEEHKRTHPDSMTFLCHVCGQHYSRFSSLVKHRREQHNICPVKPLTVYTCSICNKTFNTKNKFTEHLLLHKEPTFLCEICSKKFHTKSLLRNHNRTVHMGQYRYRCDLCGHGVDKRQYLESHKCGRVRRKQEGERCLAINRIAPDVDEPVESNRIKKLSENANEIEGLGVQKYEEVKTAVQAMQSMPFSTTAHVMQNMSTPDLPNSNKGVAIQGTCAGSLESSYILVNTHFALPIATPTNSQVIVPDLSTTKSEDPITTNNAAHRDNITSPINVATTTLENRDILHDCETQVFYPGVIYTGMGTADNIGMGLPLHTEGETTATCISPTTQSALSNSDIIHWS